MKLTLHLLATKAYPSNSPYCCTSLQTVLTIIILDVSKNVFKVNRAQPEIDNVDQQYVTIFRFYSLTQISSFHLFESMKYWKRCGFLNVNFKLEILANFEFLGV